MYVVLGMKDVTDFLSPDSEENGSSQSGGIQWSQTLSDPASTWDFVLDDINQTINVQNFQPVIVFDENVTSIGGVPTVPSMNFALNANLTSTSSLPNWTAGGTLSAHWDYGGFGNPTLFFSNFAVGAATQTQQTLSGYVQPGVPYMYSFHVFAEATIANIQIIGQMQFLDINGNPVGSAIVLTPFTPVSGDQKPTLSGVAPANAAYAQIQFGAQSTNATNSGTVIFRTLQFEPMWFANKGISYPTPDCNSAQVNSVLMPDGTCSRKCRLYAGYVEDHINAYVSKQRHTTVQCASSSKLLETAGLIAASYTSTQDTSIISNALSLLPANANIIAQLATGQQNSFAPSSTLIPGVIVDSISFNNATLREVLNGVSAQSGSIFYVDPYYYLWYVPPSFVGTVVQLSDTPDNVNRFSYYDFLVEYDSTNPVNVALVVGSKQKAAAITDTFSGDGSTTVFNLSEPPENVQTVTVAGSNIRTGVDGVDNSKFGPSSTYKALINKQRQIITFATAPASGANNTIVTYTFEDQVISQVIAADAVAQQKAQFWGLVSDSNITSTVAAKRRGLKELQDYAQPRIILTLSALNIYMPVGSLILFTCQSEGFANTPFVVQTVDADPKGGGEYGWNYTAGVYNPSLLDHIRNVHKAVKKTPTTANVAIIASIDVALFDSIHLNDSIVINHNGAPPQGPYKYGPTSGAAVYGYASYS